MGLTIAFVILLGLLALFQLALALGAPWGRLAWGGQHPGKLPPGLRVGSIVALAIYAMCALLALDRSGLIDVIPNAVSQVGMWVVFGFLALGVLVNATSRSLPERLVMTPFALVLAVLAFLIAWAPAPTQTLTGLVVGTDSEVRLCTGPVAMIYPPQCAGAGSIQLVDWDWNSTTYQQAGPVRWGNYTVTGTLDNDVMQVSSAAVAD